MDRPAGSLVHGMVDTTEVQPQGLILVHELGIWNLGFETNHSRAKRSGACQLGVMRTGVLIASNSIAPPRADVGPSSSHSSFTSQ